MNPHVTIISTADGSHTLYRADIDEHYHSIKGALAESEHIFIRSGLHFINKKEVSVLEVGFGTGLNAWLTAIDALRGQRKVSYTSLEPFPLPADIPGKLNYTEGREEHADLFMEIHRAPWNSHVQVHPGFSILKADKTLEAFVPPVSYDVIYFDAFAPQKQAELWELPVFEKCFALLNPGGTLVTYCVQGRFRRHLKEAGFLVEKLPGPPGGKREMTRAIKHSS